MGWSGATFTLLHDFSAFRDANPGAEYIDADDVDEQFTDIKGGLEALLLRDGSNSPSGSINWNGQLITNLGAPTASAHAARRQDVNKAIGPAMGGLTEYTIASGAVTPAGQAQLTIDTESDAASDDLVTITATNYTSDQIVMLRANNAARSVVVKHGSGNVNTAWNDDVTLDTLEKWVMLRYDGTDWHEVLRSPDLPTLPMREHVVGLVLSNDTDTDHDVNITAGFCVDTTGVDVLHLTSEITKQIDTTWAEGDDQGGLDTGTVAADTLYAVWLVMRSDTRVVDVLFSTSFTKAGLTLPTNYDRAQLIGAVTTDSSSNILAFKHAGIVFSYTADTPINFITDSTITDSAWETGTTLTPPNCIGHFQVAINNTSHNSTGQYLFFARGDTTSPDTSVAADQIAGMLLSGGGNILRVFGVLNFQVDGSSQVQYRMLEGAGTTTFYLNAYGFEMVTRGMGT